MHWVGLYPYRAALVAIALLVLLGGALVSSKSSQVPVSTEANTWGQAGSLSQQPGARGTNRTDVVTKQVSDTDVYIGLTADKKDKYGTIFTNDIPNLHEQIISNATTSYKDGEVEAFLASVKPSAEGITTKTAAGEDLSISDVYSYIPSNSLPIQRTSTNARTPFQEQLFNYGNEAGSAVEAHNDRYPNVANVMDRFFKDRTSAANIQGVKGLALSLAQAGREVAAIEPVPSSAESLNKQLALGYADISNKLIALTSAKTDAEIVQGITTYNAGAEMFAKANVGLATMFAAAGVRFSESESGRMFQFVPMN